MYLGNVCKGCVMEVESDLHVFGQCPCNQSINHPIINATQIYAAGAIANSHALPAFWLRGSLPKHLTQLPPESSTPEKIAYPENEARTSGVYYGDASGGGETSYNQWETNSFLTCWNPLKTHLRGFPHVMLRTQQGSRDHWVNSRPKIAWNA